MVARFGMFGKCGWPPELSAPKGRRFGGLQSGDILVFIGDFSFLPRRIQNIVL